MAGFRVLATNHTSFTVSDLDRSLAYFCDVLGFELLNRGPRDPAFIERVVAIAGADIEVAYIQAPGHRLELIEYRAPDGRKRVDSRPCDAGFAHLALDVDVVEATGQVEPFDLHPLSLRRAVRDQSQLNAGSAKKVKGFDSTGKGSNGRFSGISVGVGNLRS